MDFHTMLSEVLKPITIFRSQVLSEFASWRIYPALPKAVFHTYPVCPLYFQSIASKGLYRGEYADGADLCSNSDFIVVNQARAYDYELLKNLGTLKKPVILERNFAMTTREWLHAAEYIRAKGNTNIVLCERGVRTFESTQHTVINLASLMELKRKTPYPIIVDPTQSCESQSDLYTMVHCLSLLKINAVVLDQPFPEGAN